MKKLVIIVFCALIFGSCSNALYKYYDYDNLLYAYGTRDFSEKEIKKFSRQYSKIVELPKGKRNLPPPGACVEYALLLLQQGKTKEAKEYFVKETVYYPESQTYVDSLVKKLGL